MARTCPICGTADHACGPPTTNNGIDIVRRKESSTMTDLNTYTFVNERGQEVTLRLTADDAKARGVADYAAGAVESPVVPDLAHSALVADHEASLARIAELEQQLDAATSPAPATDEEDAVTDDKPQEQKDEPEEKQAPAPANKARQPRTPRQPRTKA